MLITIFANIGYALALLLIVAVYYSIQAKSHEHWVSAIVLCLICFPAWYAPWGNPESMASIHFGILCLSLLLLKSCMLYRIGVSILLMVLVDVIGAIHVTSQPLTNETLFWWRSALNAIFIYQCLISIKRSRAEMKDRPSGRQGNGHDGILARTIPRHH